MAYLCPCAPLWLALVGVRRGAISLVPVVNISFVGIVNISLVQVVNDAHDVVGNVVLVRQVHNPWITTHTVVTVRTDRVVAVCGFELPAGCRSKVSDKRLDLTIQHLVYNI